MKKNNCNFKFVKQAVFVIFALFFVSVGLNCQEKLFWVSADPDQVMCSNLDGSQVEIVTDSLGDPTGLGIDTLNEYLYVGLAGGSDAVVKVSFDGAEIETLINTESGVSAIQLDLGNGKIYYALFSNNIIKKADLDGSNVETVVDSTNSPNDFFIDFTEGKLYWTEYFDGFIKRCNLDGSDRETLISGQLFPCHLFFDESGSKMYWSNYIGNNINSANLDGTDHQVLMSGLSYPVGITLDLNNDHIYWASYGAKSIKRANIDGSNIITIYTATGEDIFFWTLKSTIQNNSSAGNVITIAPFELNQNYPNPFNPTTTISFELNTETTENTELSIYNSKGQLIRTLLNAPLQAGNHRYTWNGTDEDHQPVSSGVYFYKLDLGTYSQTRKLVLLK